MSNKSLPSFSAIILAGGHGTRFGITRPKQFEMVGSKPILNHSIDLFLSHPQIDQLVVVIAEEYRTFCPHTDLLFADPGARRQDSVASGIAQITSPHPLVCVHDAARPFVDRETIDRVIIRAQEVGACCCATPVIPTIKRVNKEGLVTETLQRDELWEVQTPQALHIDLLKRGLHYAEQEDLLLTDCCSAAENLGAAVAIVEGPPHNIKITHPKDLQIAHTILEAVSHG